MEGRNFQDAGFPNAINNGNGYLAAITDSSFSAGNALPNSIVDSYVPCIMDYYSSQAALASWRDPPTVQYWGNMLGVSHDFTGGGYQPARGGPFCRTLSWRKLRNDSDYNFDNVFNDSLETCLNGLTLRVDSLDGHSLGSTSTQVGIYEFGYLIKIKSPIRCSSVLNGTCTVSNNYIIADPEDLSVNFTFNVKKGYRPSDPILSFNRGNSRSIIQETSSETEYSISFNPLMGGVDFSVEFISEVYTISYNLNGGGSYPVDSISNRNSYTIETDSFTLNNPTRPGYTFKGWSGTDLTGDANKTITIPKGSTGNRTYIANWTENYIEFEYWSNNRTEDNKKFVTWKASPSNSPWGWPDNHYLFTIDDNIYKQTYPGYKPKLSAEYSTGGYYNTKPDGSGAYSVHEYYSFSSYLDVCDKYGVSYYEPATTIPIYCQWELESLVSYDTIFNYFDWYRDEIKPGNASTIISQNETGFTIRSNSGITDGYSNTSPKFKLAKENNQVIKEYIIDVDVIGSGWQLFIFFYKDDGSAALYTKTDTSQNIYANTNHTNITSSGEKREIPPEATQAAIRVDSNAANNEVTFSNFRIYPAKYYYMRYTVPENERSDCASWSAPANPTRNNNFYKFKGWSKSSGLEGKSELLNTSGKLPDEIEGGNMAVFSQWDKRSPRVFIQEANKIGGKAAPIAQLHNKPIRKVFIYTTDSNKWREC